MDEDFQWFLEQFGQPTSSLAASSETMERYRGKLPEQLLQYWARVGFAGFRNGLLFLTDPAAYEGSLEAWIGGTAIVKQDAYYVIARTAFGQMFLWGTRTGFMYDINPFRGWIYREDRHTAEISLGKMDECMRLFFSGTNPQDLDVKDISGKPMFEAAVRKLGSLSDDQVFAFEPAPTLGGLASLDRLTKRNIHVHNDLLAQLGHREILDHRELAARAFTRK